MRSIKFNRIVYSLYEYSHCKISGSAAVRSNWNMEQEILLVNFVINMVPIRLSVAHDWRVERWSNGSLLHGRCLIYVDLKLRAAINFQFQSGIIIYTYFVANCADLMTDW